MLSTRPRKYPPIIPTNNPIVKLVKVVGPGSPDFIPEGNIPKAKALLETAKTKCPADYKKATVDGITIDVRQSSTLNDTIPINEAAYARAGIKVKWNIISSGYYSTVMNLRK